MWSLKLLTCCQRTFFDHLTGYAAKLFGCVLVVSIEHRDRKQTCLRDVLARKPPCTFRVCADVIKCAPRAVQPLDIIRLFCPVCEYLYASFSVHYRHVYLSASVSKVLYKCCYQLFALSVGFWQLRKNISNAIMLIFTS